MGNSTLKTLFSAALLSIAGGAMAQDAPTFDWANYIQTKDTGGAQASSVTYDKDGVSYWMGSASTGADDQQVMVNGIDMFNGEVKVGNSAAANFVLFAFDDKGANKWNIHSTKGDYTSTSQGGVAVTDDAVYFAMSGRAYQPDQKCNLVDSKGQVYEIDKAVANQSDRYYFGIVVSASKTGEINWIRTITSTGSKGDVFCMKGFAVTASGTMVVAAQTSAEFSVPTPTGTQTITPAAANQAVVLVLDSEGYYVTHMFPTGTELGTTSLTFVKADGDNVYFAGTATPGAAALNLTFGGKTLTTGDAVSPFAAMTTDASLKEGKFEWLTSFPNAKQSGKAGINDPKMSVGVDCLWFTCGFNGDMTAGTSTISSTQGNMREGLVVKMGKDGSVGKGAISKTAFTVNALTVYEGVLQSDTDPSKAYVYGYGMNAAVGAFLREYNAETLEANAEGGWTLATNAGAPTANLYAYDPTEGVLYAPVRGNKAFTAMGQAQSQEVTSWTVFCGKFTLPASLKNSGVESVVAAESGVTVTVEGGVITVAADAAVTVPVFDIAGRCVASLKAAPGQPSTVALPAGIYFAAGTKVAVK